VPHVVHLETEVSPDNFEEEGYLRANPDVAAAVNAGQFISGRDHFDRCGRNERRKIVLGEAGLVEEKKKKKELVRPLLRLDMPFVETEAGFDFLTENLRREFNILDTSNVSSNDYGPPVLHLIRKHANGILLDCGAGKRKDYYSNVVNFEVVPYASTDVRGVGEVLPFKDSSFDAVISIAVLEHVKNPFQCAAELIRVLKPGGDLYCCVPFLQPYHGYPNHYYNMTAQGLVNLFGEAISVDSVDVTDKILPIWSLTWILQSWASGLNGSVREDFLQMRVADFLGSPTDHLNCAYVRDLSHEKNLELASACFLKAKKKVP